MKYYIQFFIYIFLFSRISAQEGLITGKVVDAGSSAPLAYVNISVNDGMFVFNSDSIGDFSITLPVGFHNLSFSYLGYKVKRFYQLKVDPVKPNNLVVELEPSGLKIDEVVIQSTINNQSSETPHSVRSIGINEINRFPGTTLDVSKVIKNLPGVLPKVSFGYNIIVRGGGSFENKFFIDGIEIPTINHFAVQGVSGGPNGMINMDILRGADLISGAFPVNRNNAVSSVLNLHTRNARNDRIGSKFTLGATDYGVTLEGPISKNSSYIVSLRKSFSEYYLKVFKLPVIPAYTDYNFKFESRWKNNEIKLIGIGGFNTSKLNLEDASAEDASIGLLYNTGYIPEGKQNIQTFGLHFKKYTDNAYTSFVLSRSDFNNNAVKYDDNTFLDEDLSLDYSSRESATRARIERKIFKGSIEYNYGINGDLNNIGINNYTIKVDRDFTLDTIDIDVTLPYTTYGAFTSLSYTFPKEKLKLFAGIRIDGSDYGEKTLNPLGQLSPRFSLSYTPTSKLQFSFSSGIYYQLPPNIVLGYAQDNAFVNKKKLDFIRSFQWDASTQYSFNEKTLLSASFYNKNYSDYPFLLSDGISYANANADYVSVGNQESNSSSEGQAYGLEIFMQRKFNGKSVWSASYQYSVSQFKDINGDFVPSSWDTRNVLSILWSKTLKRNWQIGVKFNYASGSKYTPYDVVRSSQRTFWDANRRGVFDYSSLNTASLKDLHLLDLRVDKNFYFKNWTMNLYLDVQNVYGAPIEFIPYLTAQRDEEGSFLVDPDNPQRYLMSLVNSDSGRTLPTIGIIIEI